MNVLKKGGNYLTQCGILSTSWVLRRAVGALLKRELLDTGRKLQLRCGHLEHAKLGGLTKGRYSLNWWCAEKTQRTHLDLSGRQSAARDPVRFLEPSVRLGEWIPWKGLPRRGDGVLLTPAGEQVWEPGAGLVPVPLANWNWLLATSVYLRNALIARRITNKEKSQILDLREDWGATLADHLWQGHPQSRAGPLPIRVASEFLIAAFPWFKECCSVSRPRASPELIQGLVPDWKARIQRDGLVDVRHPNLLCLPCV